METDIKTTRQAKKTQTDILTGRHEKKKRDTNAWDTDGKNEIERGTEIDGERL